MLSETVSNYERFAQSVHNNKNCRQRLGLKTEALLRHYESYLNVTIAHIQILYIYPYKYTKSCCKSSHVLCSMCVERCCCAAMFATRESEVVEWI